MSLLSDNLNEVASGLKSLIQQDASNEAKHQARIGVDYYDYQHDILNNRIFYIDDNGVLKEDRYASNVKIPHPFFTELVDQKVQYLLSNPVEFKTEDERLKEYLYEYYNEDLHVTLQEMVQGASIKGTEYLYARTTSEDKLTFDIANSLSIVPIYDDNNDLQAIVRYYDKMVLQNNKYITITYAERWTNEDVAFFIADDKGNFKVDPSKDINPRPHVLAIGGDGQTKLGRTYGTIPFYRLSNNDRNKSDLAPIKSLIDDYDIMNAFLSNNLQDFQDAIYVVKGYDGDDLGKLRHNLKAKKSIGVSSDGDVDIKTVQIPVEARKLKLEIDRENIYKFGMGFDSSQVGDGNITNVVIKSRYALLDLKCNKAEARLRAMLSWINRMIVTDINRRYNTSFTADEIDIEITRETMVNKNDIAQNEFTEAQAKATRVQAILAVAPIVGDETSLRLVCEEYDLDVDEVKQLIELQDYTSGLAAGTDPLVN